ncbi:peptide chain release factor N(5)-glutamine methyltransferase [Spiroplasma cantharicola]|uniref:peptide chain release factor N(5)-glutamine methyltransferase n=1 Tax=Spiroplasma cantharicola TaxID=362837 RepID=A0A0M4JXL3_9MOLU|nr:peptide chain release factor N(5)-glutamine methyltransferase [Spiroplasma cantharicola]ALD66880.1 release factor glutamine methyltransferase [Spiroplasma cantharicola]
MNLTKLKQKYVPLVFTSNEFNEIIIYITHNSDFNFLNDIYLSEKELDLFFQIVDIFLKTNMPLAYILNNKYFYKYDFYVNEDVLIPRQETECIVEEIMKYDLNNKNLFDICCGSGCIGITLKNLQPKLNLYMSDISPKAIEVANLNLKKYKIKAKTFVSDFLNIFDQINIVPDYITINPPYINSLDLNIENNVKKFEPHLALFAKEEGLYFYKILAKRLDFLFQLNKNLLIICEFGFEQKEQLRNIFSGMIVKYNIDFKKDYSNNWRYFVITSKEIYEK